MVDHDRFGLELPAATDVRAFISALEWEREARAALSGSNDNDEDDDRPDLEVLTDLRDRLEQLDSDITEEMEQRLLEEVKTRLEICDEWTQRVDEVLKLAGSVASAEELPAGTAVAVGSDESDAEVIPASASHYCIGVVSTDPALMMNSGAEGQYIGLKGRLPVRVTGSVKKGQALYAWQDGVCSTLATTAMVGIALESNDSVDEKLIECTLKV